MSQDPSTGQTDRTYDLFVSYAEADGAWVEGYLLDALTRTGVRVHSQEAFRLGLPRLLEFERAVQQSARTLLVLSPAYMAEGGWPGTTLGNTRQPPRRRGLGRPRTPAEMREMAIVSAAASR